MMVRRGDSSSEQDLPDTSEDSNPRGRRQATAVITDDGRPASPGLSDTERSQRFPSSSTGRVQDTVAERIGLPGLKTPISLVTLPGEKPFDDAEARRDGKYLVGDELGRGGMGRVVAARDKDLGRTVALKTLLPEHREDPAYMRALLFEARIAGQLEHPGIVPVHEMGTLFDGAAYYTMKLVGDLSLADVLSQLRAGNATATSTWTLTRLLQLLRGLCMAVEYAHARGVVHRDIKPDNIMIGDYGEVQILDWGVARILPKEEGGPSYFAGVEEPDGLVVGTPHYMSPEQARGETARVGPRSDIYSLGIILYQMLTQLLPFDAQTSEAQIEALLTAPVPPPRRRAPEREIPEELERICMRALASDPKDRYPSARAMWDDVEAFLEGKKEQERLARLAEAQMVVADMAADRYARVRGRLLELEEVVRQDELAAGYFDQLSERRDKWDRKLSADHLRLVEARTFAEAVAGYHQALAYQPALTEARKRLSALYRSKAEDALRRGDDASMVLYGDLARKAAPAHAEEEPATVNIRSYPEGAELAIYEVSGQDSLARADAMPVGKAPRTGVSLQPGSYIISATLPGCRESRVPVVLDEGETRHVLVTLQPWSAGIPTLGRADEASVIKESFATCVADGQLTSVMLQGDSGMGKGQLLIDFDAFLDQLPELVAFVYARCNELHRRVPFRTAAEIIQHRAGIDPRDPPDVVRRKVDDAVMHAFSGVGQRELLPAEVSRATETARLIACLPDLCGEAARRPDERGPELTFKVFDALATFMEHILDDNPLVLTIRGVEHIDRLTRDLLAYLAHRLRDRPVFFLAAARRDSLELGLSRIITLRPLDRESTRHQLSVLLKGPVGDGLLEVLFTLTSGNPFHVGEVARLLVGRGWVAHDGRAWDLTAAAPSDLGEAGIPALLTAGLEADAAALEVLEAAAVVGAIFWAGELSERLGRDVEPDLTKLVEAELVAPLPGTRLAGQREYAFRHDVLQGALYDAWEGPARAAAHGRVAAWLEELEPRRLADVARVARHFVRAGDEERAASYKARLAAEAAVWERPDGPSWFDWPEDLESALFTEETLLGPETP